MKETRSPTKLEQPTNRWEGVAKIVFRFGRVPGGDLSVTSVARESKPITSRETTMGTSKVASGQKFSQ